MLPRTRRTLLTATLATALAAAVVPGASAGVEGSSPAKAADASAAPTASAARGAARYVVLYAPGADDGAARAAITAAGGTVVSSDAEVGYAVVTSTRKGFERAASASKLVQGAARDRSIGALPKESAPSQDQVRRREVERLSQRERDAAAKRPTGRGPAVRPPGSTTDGAQRTRPEAARPAAPAGDPLSPLQWDMAAIHATPTGSYGVEPGKKGVRVGIIDTGIDGSHPDIAPNFDAAGSRNFTTDVPAIDGPCEVASCEDPADVDDDGHGTHVASTIGSPLNGIGVAGVAPGVTLVNLRAGQDSGYFFLQPTLDAIAYAGRSGVDVVNMSFYVDPWLFNCSANPADTPAQQAEQRTVVAAVQRALTFARSRGVLPVSASGNEATDLGDPGQDTTSPDYPDGAAHDRTIDNSTCLSVPAEQDGVVTVNATGPSGRKAQYSNYGTEQSDVSAPGGDAYDTPDNRVDPAALVLAAYPEHLARESGDVDENGDPTTPFVVKDCQGDVCGYYQYLQGTSMAAPHAAGVAALAVSRYGRPDPARRGELTLPAQTTEFALLGSATDTACPSPREQTYRLVRASGTTERTATCDGPADRNGFYGQGVVDALGAVTLLG